MDETLVAYCLYAMLIANFKNYKESMATRPVTFYTREICNYLIIRVKQLPFMQLL